MINKLVAHQVGDAVEKSGPVYRLRAKLAEIDPVRASLGSETTRAEEPHWDRSQSYSEGECTCVCS